AGTSQYQMTAQDIAAAADQVRTAESQLSQAQQALADTRVVTPVGGVVDTRPVSEGSSVVPTTVLMTIVPQRGQYFEAQVPEDAVSLVRVGDPVSVTVDAIPGKTYNGRVTDIIPVADAATKLYRVHVSVAGAGDLPENGFARGSIQVSQVKGIIVPRDALSSNVGDFYVYVIKDSHAQRRAVTLGLASDTQAQVLTGLQPGDQYVVSGVDSVTDGALVTVQPDARGGGGAGGNTSPQAATQL
ncbi:MAG: efflux RND transporter periplasmic adaptor subunit, partial [Chloroflexi bacterium]|nr:efflux RND transporter periplasmic adaptor subunit [Chloroflexota bacterium]